MEMFQKHTSLPHVIYATHYWNVAFPRWSQSLEAPVSILQYILNTWGIYLFRGRNSLLVLLYRVIPTKVVSNMQNAGYFILYISDEVLVKTSAERDHLAVKYGHQEDDDRLWEVWSLTSTMLSQCYGHNLIKLFRIANMKPREKLQTKIYTALCNLISEFYNFKRYIICRYNYSFSR